MNRPVIARNAAVLAAVSLLALGSCGVRYYSATVSGYVRSSAVAANGTQAGINGAEVLIYATDPAADPAAAPLARTGSMTSGGNDGYWSHKIMWTSVTPMFADEGDSGTVWVKIMRKGYFPKTAKVTGILSDASNVVPTIELVKIVTSEIKGKVVNENGAGVDGVRVVLDLQSTAAESDYAATSATEEAEVGVFTFSDVSWEDADSIPSEPRAIGADGKATETFRLYIDDADWYSDAYGIPNKAAQTVQTIRSDAKLDIRSVPLGVRSSLFTVPLVKGRVVDAADATVGINGVTVSLRLPISNALTVNVVTATLDGAGWYQFNDVSWRNNRPQHSAAGKHDDVTTAQVFLNDGNWYSANDADNPIVVQLTSGAVPPVPQPISAADARFRTVVKGRVVLKDFPTTGENGVAVRLILVGSGRIFTATTAALNGVDGVFQFPEVAWTDTEPTPASGGFLDTEPARLYVQDPSYASETSVSSPMIITVGARSPAAPVDVAVPLTVRRSGFSSPGVAGRLTLADGTAVEGVVVVLDLESTPNVARDATDTTDASGDYEFTDVTWTDTEPEGDAAAGVLDRENAVLYVQDANYASNTSVDNPMPVTLTAWSVPAPTDVSTPLIVAKSTFLCPTLSGFVKTAEGVPVAGVRVVLDLQSTANTAQDATDTTDDTGAFEFTDVGWTDAAPSPSTGVLDTEQAGLSVQDADYGSPYTVDNPMAITISEFSTPAPVTVPSPLTVTRIAFTCPSVTGKVADAGGNGVAGVRVILDLKSTADTAQDATALTGQNGTFSFYNVAWTDETPDASLTDTEEIQLTLDAANYEAAAQMPSRTISSDTAAGGSGSADWTITAARTARWSYSVTLSGSCTNRVAAVGGGYQDFPVAGEKVTVTVTEDFSASSPTGLQTTSPLVTRTGANGSWSLSVSWSRMPGYTPSATAQANGGDTLAVSVVSDAATGTIDAFPTPVAVDLLSWTSNIVNSVVVTP